MGFSIRSVGAINDMPKNWKRQSELNYRIYNMWVHMIRRCYSEEVHKRRPTYKDCVMQKELLYLSTFVNWIEQEEYYQDFVQDHSCRKWCIDKDMLVEGNKEYAIGKIKLVTFSANSQDANKRIDHKKSAQALTTPIVRINEEGVVTFYSSMTIAEQDGYAHSKISDCCRGKRKRHGKCQWFYLDDFARVQLGI